MDKKPTIMDVARHSGVSISTVSLALNAKPGVSEETRARVFNVASELGYAPKITAAPGARAELNTVGMIVKVDPDQQPQANPFYSKVIVGIEDACRRKGINLLFSGLPVDKDNCPVEIPTMLTSNLVDGLLMVGAFVDETILSMEDNHTNAPIVLVDGYSNTQSFDAVVSDNFRAAYQAVEYLVHKGHRHIGLIGGEKNAYPSLLERRNGYLRALKDNGLTESYNANFNINQSHGEEQTIALLQKNPHLSALFCINDDVGVTAIQAAQSLGRRVPADLSVIGYDNTYIAAHAHPPLTTMHVDTLAMGRAAVQLLALRVENADSARMTLTIHPTLVERGSVGPAQARPPA
ncbi:MAG TPA: LacI family DNA-binding transcriptional regulator [Anaerolineales bacterium]|nr:LacI family DNA-binding transcriptional regulator [Anaerolineales bacterium]